MSWFESASHVSQSTQPFLVLYARAYDDVGLRDENNFNSQTFILSLSSFTKHVLFHSSPLSSSELFSAVAEQFRSIQQVLTRNSSASSTKHSPNNSDSDSEDSYTIRRRRKFWDSDDESETELNMSTTTAVQQPPSAELSGERNTGFPEPLSTGTPYLPPTNLSKFK